MVSLIQGEIINHGMMHACAKITPSANPSPTVGVCDGKAERDAK